MDALFGHKQPDVLTRDPLRPDELPAKRATIAHFSTFAAALELAEDLRAAGLETDQVYVVADNLIAKGEVIGRFGGVIAALKRSYNAIIIGAVLGLGFGITGFFSPIVSNFSLAFYRIVFGAVVGFTVAILDHLLINRRRAFTAKDGVYSELYAVQVDAELELKARGIAAGEGVDLEVEEDEVTPAVL